MFHLIEDKAEIAKSQKKLEATISRELPVKIMKDIGWVGGRQSGAVLRSDGLHWYWSSDHAKSENPRRLNWFGVHGAGPGVQITVEINTPYEGRNDMVAGLFARNSHNGRIYLLHSGRVGGGRKGVSKTEFLAWSDQELVTVWDANGKAREAVLVMPIEGEGAVRSAINYVQAILEFKQAVREGLTETVVAKERVRKLRAYFDERGGRKTGKVAAHDIDYLSRHWEVVRALRDWREMQGMKPGLTVVKDTYIDLGVAAQSKLVELYEVKTSTVRSDIYTAIGQLTVHSPNDACRRVIVLPTHQPLANDLAEGLKRRGIEVMRFRLTANQVKIPE
jgi:hypothetical protein